MPANLTQQQIAQALALRQNGTWSGANTGGNPNGTQQWYDPNSVGNNDMRLQFTPGGSWDNSGENSIWKPDPSQDRQYISQVRPDTGGNVGDWWNTDGTYGGEFSATNGGGRDFNQAALMIGGVTGANIAGAAAAGGANAGSLATSDIGIGGASAGGGGTTGTLGSTSGAWNGVDFGGTAAGTGGGTTGGVGGALTSGLSNTAIKAGVGLVGGALADNGSNNSVDLSQTKPVDLANNINATGQQNWQNQLQASRYNSVTPDGSSTWSQTPQFNEAGFNSAMQQWEAAGNPNLPKPTREQFTSQQWTNTSSLSPEAQALADSQRRNNQLAADALPAQATNYVTRANAGADRSGIPGYQYSATTQDQGQIDLGQRPNYGQVAGPGSMENPTYGDINRGGLVSSAEKTARDWASNASGRVNDWTDELAGLDPFMFDQQGSDAMWGVSSRYLLPQQAAEKQAMEARLGEQGFVPGTPAYDTALKQMLDSQSLAQADARDRATLAGRQFGDQAFDNRAGALNSAIAGQMSLGNLGIATDRNMFDQNLSNAQLANSAQAQDFAQQKALSEQQFQEGLSANDVVKQLFGMNMDTVNANNKWAGQDFQDLLSGTASNNSAIGANNQIALQLAGLNNSAVNSARGQANADFTTDINAQRNATTDLFNAQGQRPVGPAAGQSNVPGANQADIASILQQYFGNNVDLANQNTASSNARTAAIGQLLASLFGNGG